MQLRSSLFIWLPVAASAFVVMPSNGIRRTPGTTSGMASQATSRSSSGDPPSVDVSDLGLTIDDMNKPLPPEMLSVMSTTGYESTNKVESIQDDGCEWTESLDNMDVKLKIPGLRGQPAGAMSVLFSRTTISVSVFGRVVWSAILRGKVNPDDCQFEAEEGADMVPTVRLSVRKESTARWGGFILQVGEDSLV
jgi:hypothetical protein